MRRTRNALLVAATLVAATSTVGAAPAQAAAAPAAEVACTGYSNVWIGSSY
jgi:hypothetical protein